MFTFTTTVDRYSHFLRLNTQQFSIKPGTEVLLLEEKVSLALSLSALHPRRWLPNCIALFLLALASTNPSCFAANLRTILSPTPGSNLGSSLWWTGSSATNLTNGMDRKGCLTSLPWEEITLSSLPRLRIGIRLRSIWSWGERVAVRHPTPALRKSRKGDHL